MQMEILLRHILKKWKKWNLFYIKADIRVYSSRVRSERARRQSVITENRTWNYPINNIDNHYKTPKYFRYKYYDGRSKFIRRNETREMLLMLSRHKG